MVPVDWTVQELVQTYLAHLDYSLLGHVDGLVVIGVSDYIPARLNYVLLMMLMAVHVMNHVIARVDGQHVTQPGHVEVPGAALVIAEAALFPAEFKFIFLQIIRKSKKMELTLGSEMGLGVGLLSWPL